MCVVNLSEHVARLRGITSDCDERPSCTPSHSKPPVPHRRDTFLRFHNHLQHSHTEIYPLPYGVWCGISMCVAIVPLHLNSS